MSLSTVVHFFLIISSVAGVLDSVLPSVVHHYVSKHFDKYSNGIDMYFCSLKDALKSFASANNQLINRKLLSLSKNQSNFDSNAFNRVLVFLDASCPKGKTFLEKNKHFISRRFTWLINMEDATFATNAFNETRLGFDSDLTVLISSKTDNLRIIQISRPISPYPLEITKNYSIIDVIDEKKKILPTPLNGERIDFGGKIVSVGLVLNNYKGGEVPEWSVLLNRTTNESPIILYNSNIAKYLLDMYNFKANVTANEDWGMAYPNGTMTGLIRGTAVGELEIDFGSLDVNPINLDNLDVTCNMFHLKLVCLLTQGTTIGAPTALIVPFSRGTWITFMVTVICLVLIVRLTVFTDSEQRQNDSIGGSIILVFAGIRQNGIPDIAHRFSTRLIYIVVAFSTYLVYQYYSVGILKGLVITLPPAIRTYEQLLASDVEIHSRDSAHLRHIPGDEANPVGGLWNRMSPPIYVPDHESLVRVKRGKYGIVEGDVLWGDTLRNYYNDRETCALTEILHPYTFKVSFGVTKFSPMTEILNRGITLMNERGIINYMHGYWFTGIPKSCVAKIDFAPITLQGMALAYSILGIGLVVSITIFVIELLISKRAEDKNKVRPFVI